MTNTQEDVLWCNRTFKSLALGGVWAVPRSGLIFMKKKIQPPTLELVEHMKYQSEIPMKPDEWREFQKEDLAKIQEVFAEAGITVTGEIK